MIKTIVFDIGDVVWNYQVPCRALHDNFAKLLRLTPDAYRQEYLKVYRDFETDKKQLLSWCQSFVSEATQKEIDDILLRFLSPTIFDKYLNHNVVDLIKKLKNIYTVGYLSNGENYFIPYVYRPLDPLFHFCLVSSRISLRKPDPLSYQEIYKHVDCLPKEIVFVDDKPENIAGAQSLGINSILFTDHEKLLHDLSSYLPVEVASILPAPTVRTK